MADTERERRDRRRGDRHRGRRVQIWLPSGEIEAWQQAARAQRMTVSDWVRRAVKLMAELEAGKESHAARLELEAKLERLREVLS